MKKQLILTSGLVCVGIFSGCQTMSMAQYQQMNNMTTANMITKQEDKINEKMKPKAYKNMESFKQTANTKLSTLQSAKCTFKNPVWTKDVKNGTYIYYGKCDKNGKATGFGGLFENKKSNKIITKWTFNKGAFPIYVGNFKSGKMDGKGYLTQKADYRKIVDFDVKIKKEFYKTHPKEKDQVAKQLKMRMSFKDRLAGKKPDVIAYYKKQKLDFSLMMARPSGGINVLGVNYGGKVKKTAIDNTPIILNVPKYYGDFKNNKENGKGIEFNKLAKISYVGSIKNGKKYGEGVLYKPEYYIFQYVPRNAIKQNNNPIVKIKSNFKNGKLNGKTALTYADCKKFITTYKNGKIKFPARIYVYAPTTSVGAAVQNGRISMHNVHLIYGYEKFATYDKHFKPTKGAFYSYTQDDDKYITMQGHLDKKGRFNGIITAIVQKKQVGDLTNKTHFTVVVGENPIQVYKAIYKHGKLVKYIQKSNFSTLKDAYNKLAAILSVLKGISPISAKQYIKLTGNIWNKLSQSGDISQKCKDLAKFGENMDNLFNRYDQLNSIKKLR